MATSEQALATVTALQADGIDLDIKRAVQGHESG